MIFRKLRCTAVLFFFLSQTQAQTAGPLKFKLFFPDSLKHSIRGFNLGGCYEDTTTMPVKLLEYKTGWVIREIINNKEVAIGGFGCCCGGRLFATDEKDTMVIDFPPWPDGGIPIDSIIFMPGYFFYKWGADTACTNSYLRGKPSRCYVLPSMVNSEGLKRYNIQNYKELITQRRKQHDN